MLKGTVAGHLRDADDDHYQILVSAGGTMFRVAVNVHSSLKPPDLLFQSLTTLPAPLTSALKALSPGFKKLASQPGGLAQDFVRGGLVKVKAFKVVPGNVPGAANDLKDTMEDAVLAAIGQAGSIVYAFGARWGPETKKDQYFKFAPGNGIHDIHMNQGNDKAHAGDDGIFHDGCLIFQYPNGRGPRLFPGLPVAELRHRRPDGAREEDDKKRRGKKKSVNHPIDNPGSHQGLSASSRLNKVSIWEDNTSVWTGSPCRSRSCTI